jgi:WD40 repeat protein
MKKPKPSAAAWRTEITDATRRAFTELRAAHPQEAFYAYALYTSNDASYVMASANSEEGLRQRARKYQAKAKTGLEEEMRRLRWHAPDWAYHGAGEEHFAKVEDLLEARPGLDDLDEDAWEKEVELRMATFVEALHGLDKEGFFGRGKSREKVTLLLTMGDQETKSFLKCARQLNPAKVYDRLSKPFLRTDAGRFQGLGSRKVYETNGVAIAGNGRLLATAGDGFLFAFSLPNRNEILKVRLEDLIGAQAVAVSPDARAVALGWGGLAEEEGGIRCWNMESRKVLWDVAGEKDAISTLDFSPDGQTIVSGGMDGSLAWWDAPTGKPMRRIRHKNWVQCVRFAPRGNLLASLDRAKGVRLWDASSGKPMGEIAEPGDRLTFSPDGQLLAIASRYVKRDLGISLWDVARRKLVKRLEAVTKSRFQVMPDPDDDDEDCEASGAAFSPDGRFLAVERSNPGSVVLWDWKDAKELTWMNPNSEALAGVVFLPDGKTVAVAGCSMDGPPLLLWDVAEAVRK